MKLSTLMKLSVVIALASLMTAGLAVPGRAADEPARFNGRVQWIAGVKMLVQPRAGGQPVNVDLSRVSQDAYSALRGGDWVLVDGVVSSDGRWIVANTVVPTGGRGERVDSENITIPPQPVR